MHAEYMGEDRIATHFFALSMGVPAFFKWLCARFPKVIMDAIEEEPMQIDGHFVPFDLREKNPNEVEFDHLYLDMNGIIHPCCHPEDKAEPTTEEEMFQNIWEYTDKIMRIVRPRKLLYIAIDGVAPRAKMNQQRSRRFKSAQEAREKEEEEERLRREWKEEGLKAPPKKSHKKAFDSNVITPGTPFMERLATSLRFYITRRLHYDPSWEGLKVILSDANVPGEGEHKIMEFIRLQRTLPNYDPNLVHCLYGADADLIMLGLATHEAHFYILREIVFQANERKCFLCGQLGHLAAECTGEEKQKTGEFDERGATVASKPFQFIKIPVLREYLWFQLRVDSVPFGWDFERCIDDFVFLCFFVGNDFLPHLPSLSIHEGAIDMLLMLYKTLLPSLGGYLTENGDVHLDKVDVLLSELGRVEDRIFQQRKEKEARRKEVDANKRRRYAQGDTVPANNVLSAVAVDRSTGPVTKDPFARNGPRSTNDPRSKVDPNKAAAAALRASLSVEEDGNGLDANKSAAASLKSTWKSLESDDESANESGQAAKSEQAVPVESASEPTATPGLSEATSGSMEVEPRAEPAVESTPSVDSTMEPVEQEKKRKLSDMQQPAVETVTTVTETATAGAGADVNMEMSLGGNQEGEEEVMAEGTVANSETDMPPAKKAKIEGESTVEPAAAALAVLEAAEKVEEDAASVMEEIEPTPLESIVNQDIESKPTKSPEDLFNLRLKEVLKARADFGEQEDTIKLHEAGFKDRYYKEKFNIDSDHLTEFRRKIQKAYVEGLCWVLSYYYKGCVSWEWFYPFHYAPFASDLLNCDVLQIKFHIGRPFKPFEQLLAVMPPDSSHCLPDVYHPLMKDPDSLLIDFYPIDFKLDMNGKRWAWLGVVLLPFIDQKRLLREAAKIETQLNVDEEFRNSLGSNHLFVHRSHAVAEQIKQLYPESDQTTEPVEGKVSLDFSDKSAMGGYLTPVVGSRFKLTDLVSPVDSEDVIERPSVVTAVFHNPDYVPHLTTTLRGAVFPEYEVTEHELQYQNINSFGGRDAQRLLSQTVRTAAPGSNMNRLPSVGGPGFNPLLNQPGFISQGGSRGDSRGDSRYDSSRGDSRGYDRNRSDDRFSNDRYDRRSDRYDRDSRGSYDRDREWNRGGSRSYPSSSAPSSSSRPYQSTTYTPRPPLVTAPPRPPPPTMGSRHTPYMAPTPPPISAASRPPPPQPFSLQATLGLRPAYGQPQPINPYSTSPYAAPPPQHTTPGVPPPPVPGTVGAAANTQAINTLLQISSLIAGATNRPPQAVAPSPYQTGQTRQPYPPIGGGLLRPPYPPGQPQNPPLANLLMGARPQAPPPRPSSWADQLMSNYQTSRRPPADPRGRR
eukprot:GILK01014314.1.p1 GENE.GILK01014314.1~~GILK01014314.1.p1  ORF type:complete len:1359 (-),score=329.11 GILK01014314.1:114-4190(-)